MDARFWFNIPTKRIKRKSLRVSVLRTLYLSDGTTDTLSSEAGSLLVQFGEVLEERHFDSAANTDEMNPGIYSMSGKYLAACDTEARLDRGRWQSRYGQETRATNAGDAF